MPDAATPTPLRDREHSGVTRDRLRREIKRAIRPAVVIVVGIVAAGVAAGIVVRNLDSQLPWGDYYDVRIRVDDVSGIRPGEQEVRIAGVKVGRITDIGRRPGGAWIAISIDGAYAPLHRDARVRVRPQTPVQDLFVDIEDRGSRAAGVVEEGAELSAERTRTPVQIGRVLDVFNEPTRNRFETMIDEAGRGLADRGAQLRMAFQEMTPFLKAAQRLTRETAVRRTHTRRLIHNLRLVMDELGRRDAQVEHLVRNASATFSALADASPSLDRFLANLPPTVEQLRSTSVGLRAALAEVDPALVAFRPVVNRLNPALRSLTDLSEHASPSARALRRLLRHVGPVIKDTAPLANDLARAFTRLRPTAPRLDQTTKAIPPCRLAVQKFFQWNPSVFKLTEEGVANPRGEPVGAAAETLVPLPSCAKGAPGP